MCNRFIVRGMLSNFSWLILLTISIVNFHAQKIYEGRNEMRIDVRIILLLLILPICTPHPSLAQARKNAQVGDIDVEDVKAENAYNVNQSQVIDFFSKFDQQLDSSLIAHTKGSLTENQLSFLNGVYLYCTVNTGTCPDVLESLYEVDYINSKASGSASCPLMTQFWKLWIKNDMESRQSYLIKTSNITITSDFTSKVRPRYIKCLESIKQDLANNKGITAKASVKKTIQILGALKDKNINVFNATGSYPQPKEGTETAEESAKR